MATLAPQTKFGNFQIVRHIGGGGTAQIYLAKTRGVAGFEKFLALKVINADFEDDERFIHMLINEAKIVVGLAHENIVQVLDLGEYRGQYYIVMEFVDGLDVLDLVNGLYALHERVPVPVAAYVTRDVCAGLHYAHISKDKHNRPLNIIHRDISPQNVLLSRAGVVKVTDFGIAKAVGLGTKTRTGVVKGKMHYMAPEIVTGGQASVLSDVFSIGIVMWEMLTSKMVYRWENVGELVSQVSRADIPPPSSVRADIPREVDAVVMRALARRPEDRFASALEMQIALNKFLASNAPEMASHAMSQIVERVLAARTDQPMVKSSNVSRAELVEHVQSVIGLPVDPNSAESKEYTESSHSRLMVETKQGSTVHILGPEQIIGRLGQIVLPDTSVSRRHAIIREQDQAYWLEDLGSFNGTVVNGEKIAAPHQLRHQDKIRIGTCRLTFLEATNQIRAAEANLATSEQMFLPRLRLLNHAQKLDKPLALDEELLCYQIQLGNTRITGRAAILRRREQSYWIEPATSRIPILFQGSPLRGSRRLLPGDIFEAGQFTFEYRHGEQAPSGGQ